MLSGEMDTWPEAEIDDRLVKLARDAVHLFVETGRKINPPHTFPTSLHRKAAAFVSVRKHGALRGCVGTVHPVHETLAEEIVAQAIRAVSADPRFAPVRPDELEDLDISVDVLSPPEICRPSDLDPAHYGVIVEHAGRRGLLLPDLPGVETVETQLEIARQKASLPPHAPVTLSRFTVERHTAHGRRSTHPD